jgi:four helix bundle protein
MSIAHKEARESRYWIRVGRTAMVKTEEWKVLQDESEELARILSAIINSAQRKTR